MSLPDQPNLPGDPLPQTFFVFREHLFTVSGRQGLSRGTRFTIGNKTGPVPSNKKGSEIVVSGHRELVHSAEEDQRRGTPGQSGGIRKGFSQETTLKLGLERPCPTRGQGVAVGAPLMIDCQSREKEQYVPL